MGNPRTCSSRPPEGVARATNSIDPPCAAARGAMAINANAARIIASQTILFMLHIVAEAEGVPTGMQFAPVVMVNGRAQRSHPTAA